MERALRNLKSAAEELRTVARHLHYPLDTSTFDKAFKVVEEELKVLLAKRK